jgi:uncharacterized DUF497 family protein
MDFDWQETHFELTELTRRDIEESHEDPFSIRLLPEFEDDSRDARYFCLGKSIGNRPIFSVFWTDGKIFRVIFARDMTSAELAFYDRKNAEMQ